MNRKVIFWAILMMICVATFVSAQTTGINITGAQKGLQDFNKDIFGILKTVVSIVLFLVAVWQFIEGYMSHSLQSKWMTLIGIAIFIAALNSFPYIFATLSGMNEAQFITK